MSRPSKDQNQITQAPSLVEELARLAWDAANRHMQSDIAWEAASKSAQSTTRAEVQAILSALASKGVDGMPSVDEIGQHCWDTLSGEDSSIGWSECDRFAPVMYALIRSRLAPIFAAKDAERDALRARVAELEARISATGDKQ